MPVLVLVLYDFRLHRTHYPRGDGRGDEHSRISARRSCVACRIAASFCDTHCAMRLIAPFTLLMLHVNWLIAGVIVVEYFFAFKGFGSLILEASLGKDLYLLEACTMIAVAMADDHADDLRSWLSGAQSQDAHGMSDADDRRRTAAHFAAPRLRMAQADRAQQGGGVRLAIVGFWILVAIAAPWIAPFPPNQTIMSDGIAGRGRTQRSGVLVRH